MPSAPSEEEPCDHSSSAIARDKAKVTSGSVPLPLHLSGKPKDKCVDPAETSPKVIRIPTKGGHLCDFYHVRVCLLGEFHPVFRKGVGRKGNVIYQALKSRMKGGEN